MAEPSLPAPRQGEIWFTRLPTDPAGKYPRPVAIVSIDARNQNPRAMTVLVIPLTTTIRNPLPPTQLLLMPGETGLREQCVLDAGGITTLPKSELRPPRERLRQLGHVQIRRIARLVMLAMGVFADEVPSE